MKTTTQKAFIESSHIDGKLIRAVVRQMGGWGNFKESAQDVVNNGADCGFNGFIYYVDTMAFYAKNQQSVVALAERMAAEFGTTTGQLVAGFNCLNGDFTEYEIVNTLWGTKRKHETQVANALAWFALEEVCRSFVDIQEEGN